MRWYLPSLLRVSLTGYVLGLLLIPQFAWAWDGEWTQGRSGNTGLFEDTGSSHGKSGYDPPQKFPTPEPRDFADVDSEELGDYFKGRKKDYAPYALARIMLDIRYNHIVIPKGYYLIKPGDVEDGSASVKLETASPPDLPIEKQDEVIATWSPPSSLAKFSPPESSAAGVPSAIHPISQNAQLGAQQKPASTAAAGTKQDEPAYRVFVLIRQGKVVAVVPIHSMEDYRPPRKENIPKRALAWVEMVDRHPVLKFYYKKRIYTTHFQ